GVGTGRRSAKAGEAPNDRFVRVPAWPHKRPVVKAGGEERMRKVNSPQKIEPGTRPADFGSDFEIRRQRNQSRSSAGDCTVARMQLHECVGFFHTGAENPPRPVVLETARDNTQAIRE